MGKIDQPICGSNDYLTHPGDTEFVSMEQPVSQSKPLAAVYVALVLFMLVYWFRPEDWTPALSHLPVVKITGMLALLSFVYSLRHVGWSVLREALFLVLLTGQLIMSAVVSPVWRTGALETTFDFAKVAVIAIVMVASVNTLKRLRLLIFIQVTSIAVIAAAGILNGNVVGGRLGETFEKNYANSNDLAVAIAISLPLCLAFLFLAKNIFLKTAWALAMMMMTYAMFLTGSRAGFLSLVIAAAICLWEFAIRGRRRYLIGLAVLAVLILWQFSGGTLGTRLRSTFDPKQDDQSAFESAKVRQQLFWRSIEVTEEHPLFGVGAGNFMIVSGSWLVSHNSFTQVSSEGGVPALILYVLILWRGFTNLGATKRICKRQTQLRVWAAALTASAAGYVIGSLFASTAYLFFPYFLMAYTSAIYWIAKQAVIRSRYESLIQEAIPDGDGFANKETASVYLPSV